VIAKDLLLGRRGDVVTIEPFADLAAAANVLSERRMSYPGRLGDEVDQAA
jgi:hypothetical protein